MSEKMCYLLCMQGLFLYLLRDKFQKKHQKQVWKYICITYYVHVELIIFLNDPLHCYSITGFDFPQLIVNLYTFISLEFKKLYINLVLLY